MQVLITGANRGIGLALTRELVARGHKVWATVRTLESAAELQALGHAHVQIFTLDVGDVDSVKAFARVLPKERLDVLVNNAGVMSRAKIDDLKDDDFAKVMDTNVMGALRVVRELRERLVQGRAKMFHISSTLGSLASTTGSEYLAYRISKAGLNMAGVALANEFRGNGVASILVHPGWVQTDMGGAAAPLKANESARGIADLIENKGLESSGKFFQWDGKELPW